jgi:membrane-bound metal-dependent hydrolase YbcI (DUF457 family)
LNAVPAIVLAIVAGWLWPPPDAWYQPAVLALAAAAPELDRAIGAFSPVLAARTYRGAGHSIPALLGWAAAIAATFHAIDPHPGFATAAILAAIGVVVHALVDLASPSGLALLGRRRIGSSVLAPQDVVLVTVPALALGLGVAWEGARLAVAAGTCLFLLYFVGLRLAMRRRAETIGKGALGRAPDGTFPTPWSPFVWLCVSRDGSARRVVRVDVGKKKAGDVQTYEAPASGPLVDALEASGAIMGKGEGRWILDLRYAYPWPVVVSGIELDEEGRSTRVRLP